MHINSNAQQANGVHGNHNPASAQVASAYQAEGATKPLPNLTDSVTLSAEAMALSMQPPAATKGAETLPATPTLPNEGEKVDNYVEYRKAKAQYQIYSDMAGVATANSNSLSPVTAYYVSNNDEARTAVVDNHAQQQSVAAMQTYAQVSQNTQQWVEDS